MDFPLHRTSSVFPTVVLSGVPNRNRAVNYSFSAVSTQQTTASLPQSPDERHFGRMAPSSHIRIDPWYGLEHGFRRESGRIVPSIIGFSHRKNGCPSFSDQNEDDRVANSAGPRSPLSRSKSRSEAASRSRPRSRLQSPSSSTSGIGSWRPSPLFSSGVVVVRDATVTVRSPGRYDRSLRYPSKFETPGRDPSSSPSSTHTHSLPLEATDSPSSRSAVVDASNGGPILDLPRVRDGGLSPSLETAVEADSRDGNSHDPRVCNPVLNGLAFRLSSRGSTSDCGGGRSRDRAELKS